MIIFHTILPYYCNFKHSGISVYEILSKFTRNDPKIISSKSNVQQFKASKIKGLGSQVVK